MQSYRRGRVASRRVTCVRRGAAARVCAPFSWGGAGSRCLLACFPTGDDAMLGTTLPLPPLPRASCLAATRLPSPSTAARRPTEFAKDREGPSSPSPVARSPVVNQLTNQPIRPSKTSRDQPVHRSNDRAESETPPSYRSPLCFPTSPHLKPRTPDPMPHTPHPPPYILRAGAAVPRPRRRARWGDGWGRSSNLRDREPCAPLVPERGFVEWPCPRVRLP